MMICAICSRDAVAVALSSPGFVNEPSRDSVRGGMLNSFEHARSNSIAAAVLQAGWQRTADRKHVIVPDGAFLMADVVPDEATAWRQK